MSTYKWFLLLAYPLFACSTMKRRSIEVSSTARITMSNFPSFDTASITFMKESDKWYVQFKSRNYTLAESPPIPCNSCDSIFTKAFLSGIMNLQSEEVTNDCTLYSYAIADGDSIVEIDNFYNHSHLRVETINLQYLNQEKSIWYFEPRLAIRYCKSNEERLKFILFSDVLRSIR